MKKTAHIVTLAFAFVAAACGTDSSQLSGADQSPPPSEVGTIDEGVFKMYEQANVTPQSFCDLHTILRLENTRSGISATMENSLEGICEIAVFANTRTYDLKKVASSCGSNIYKGSLSNTNDKAAKSIEVIDHRTRVCRDIVPATVIIKEALSETAVRTLYSNTPIAALISLAGTLTRIAAIGGESTGYGLQLANGDLVEIELCSVDLMTSFSEGKKVTISGNYKTVRGIEIPVRQVFVVKTMTAI